MRPRLVRILALIAAIAAIAVTACAGGAPSQEFGKADIDQIKQNIQQLVTAYNAKDIEKIGACFSNSASVMPANRSTLRGIDLVKAFYEERVKIDGATDLVVEPMAIEGQGSLAFVTGTFSLNVRPPDGSAERRDRGKIMWIVRKLGGQWRFEWQIMSSDLPPVLPPAAPAPK